MTSPLRKPRVLHVISVLSVGGVEVWLIELLRHMRSLAEVGREVEQFDILMTGGSRGELDDLAASLGANLHYLRFSRRHFLTFARGLRGLLESGNYIAIHDHQDLAAGWHLLAAAGKLPGLRIVHVHNAPARLRAAGRTRARRVLLRLSGRAIRSYGSHVLGTSSQILRDYGFVPKSFPRQRIKTLHCGFDVSRFGGSHADANASLCAELGWKHGARIALFVGRLEGFDESNPGWNGKNPEFALQVARAAIDDGCEMHFVMVGGGETVRSALELELRASGHADRIRLVGKRSDVPRIMAASHVLLFPSLEEGLGMVAVEAQAAGLRVIASDTVSREASVIDDLVTFLPLSDGVPVWTRHLCEAMSAPRFDAQEASRRVSASPYSIEESYAQLHSIYASADHA
jgi:glycosyltransferase involved in cell wall biosynthesis